ncbi:PQQ-dependent catabolism-associated CXXCW motif protein [Paracoccus suum]|uniref:PQQ-dependent catabolism-associated CXXCW motif protein n=1 Tax=Paracoccus suum TaxID=2259340 RepID=A0A344PLQ3_9RHOB|nr:rhodanese-like domain-containing protein [Paracoccus suum]AXC50308.1 PQQ-dependent catabolism-associated CXXCW motif protein [Paracoccus suum]
MRRLLATALAALALAIPAAAETVPEPDSYHAAPYEAPVPETLRRANVVDAAGAMRLREAGAAFIDVLPQTRRPEGLPAGTFWRVPPHDSIPGALWLPDAGFERLTPTEEAALSAGLQRATGGDRDKPLVIFCRPDCWLSWNAARRAVALGYSAVNWFPGGTAAWEAAGGTLEPVAPSE